MKKIGGNIILGVIERDEGYIYNSAISFGKDGSQKYRKYHLTSFYVFKNYIPNTMA